MGRPTDYNKEIADLICERIADGETLKAICQDPNLPNKSTVFRWLIIHPEFSDLYARAREAQGDALIEEAREIADDGSADYVIRSRDGEHELAVDHEHIARSKLRVDQRRWEASKLKPRTYGDKLAVEHSGTINLTATTDDEIMAQILELLTTGRLKLPEGVQLAEDEEPDEEGDDYDDVA